jgi:hypothetical protein
MPLSLEWELVIPIDQHLPCVLFEGIEPMTKSSRRRCDAKLPVREVARDRAIRE